MAGHPVVPFDQALIDDIAAAMDLRAPNREALEALAKRFDDAGGEPFEGAAVTRYDGGWVHVVTRSERCAPPHRTLAAPATIAPEPYPPRT